MKKPINFEIIADKHGVDVLLKDIQMEAYPLLIKDLSLASSEG